MKRTTQKRSNYMIKASDIAPWLFILPSFLLVSILVLIPFADVVRRSFFSALGGQFTGLQNYRIVLENQAFQLAAKNTIRFTLVCIPLLLIFSLLLALLIDAGKEKKGIFKTTFLVPLSIPVASVVLLWQAFFHDKGVLNRLLMDTGVPAVPWLTSGCAFGVLIFTYIWKNAGYTMLLWLSGLSAISPSLYESSALDGASGWKRFLYITFPNLFPVFFTVLLLSLLNSFKVFREAFLIAGSYPHESIYLLQHLFQNWFSHLDMDKMCAGAVLLALAVAVVIGLLRLIFQKGEE